MRDINNVITGTLNAAAKTVTFSTVIKKALLLTIVNVEDNIEIYTANDATKGGSLNGGGTVLTLNYDTTSMSNGDLLQVIYEGLQSTELASVAQQDAQVVIMNATLVEAVGTNTRLGGDITTPSPVMPAGGSGVLGWLSSIWTKLNATLAVSGTVSVTGVATAANQGTELTFLSAIQAQLVSNGSVGATAANQVTEQGLTGSLTETAPGTDTASSGLNGRLQRIAQRLTSLIALLPAALGAGGGLKVDGSGTALPVSGTITATPVKASTANTPSILTSGGDVIASNASRKSWGVQNLGTNPLFVRMATGASSTVFHFCLGPGQASDDGLGASVADDTYTGVVSATGTSPRFVVYEL
jgi:hypothetical protein